MDAAHRKETTVLVLAIVLTLGWYFEAIRMTNPHWTTREPGAYYEQLTEAILSGHTYLRLKPDPRLAELPNPWGGAQGIPRAHDATYFNGRYYIYFGVAPVILLFAPWRLLTGTYLVEGMGTGVFCTLGFLLAACFFWRCKRRFFSGLSPVWTFFATLTLGLGSYVQFELKSAQFYEVPIACAFACSMGAAHAVLSAVWARTQTRRAAALAIASMLCACAVGARPNYVFNLLALGGVALWLWRVQRRETPGPWSRGWPLLLAAIGPAALVGSALAAYNYARFGSIFEFGLKYQLAAIDMRHFKLVSPHFVPPALRAYLLAGKEYTPYYPFVRQNADTFGLIPWVPFALFAFGFPLTWCRSSCRTRGWVLGAGFPLAIALTNLGTLLTYFYLYARYELDFVPALMLAALLSASMLLDAVREKRSSMGRVARYVVGGALAFTLVHSILFALPLGMDRPSVRAWARLLEYPAFWGEKLMGVKQGPVAMEVEFPARPALKPEPLVSTGQGRDVIYAKFPSAGHVQFGFFHEGAGGPLSEPLAITPGRRYQVIVDLGGLYPPSEYPAFAGWNQDEIDALRRRVQVTLDGRTVFRAASPFYASDPLSVRIGNNSRLSEIAPRFTGHIFRADRLGIPRQTDLQMDLGSGPVRLRVHFPPFAAMVGEPLVCTGRNGAGDLVYVFYLGPGKVRFGHDSWNGGAVETEPVYFDPDQDQVIDIDMGSLYPGAKNLRSGQYRFQLRFNGQNLISVPRPFNPSTASEVVFGYNAIQASTAGVMFGGSKLQASRLPAFPPSDRDGAVVLRVELPMQRAGKSDPLVVTGQPGKGDFIYIQYPDAQHMRIGYDHWGVGGAISRPIPLDEGPIYEIEVGMGSLYHSGNPELDSLDAADRKRLRSEVCVRVNGREVLRTAGTAYPASADEVYVGHNPIGGSTCGPIFSGRIVQSERVGLFH